MRYLAVGAVSLLAAVFAVSALSKLRDEAGFTASLRELRLLPARWVRAVAATVTAYELVLAGGLVAAGVVLVASDEGAPALAALAGAGLLLIALTTGIALALRRGTGGRCACFGTTQRPLGRRHLVRNGALLLAALAGPAGLGDHHPVRVAGALVAIGAGLLGAVLLIRLDDLVDLLSLSPSPASNLAARR